MNLSGIRLVVSDMDGTLLNSSHEVSPLFFELFAALKHKGILFAAASGRQYSSIEDKLSPIKDDIIIIAENGGFAVHQGREIVSTPLNGANRKEVLEVLEQLADVYPVLCGKGKAYIQTRSPFFINKLKEYYTEYEIIDDLKDFEGEIMKIAVYHDEDSETYIYPNVRQFENALKVKVSGENWVDLSHKDAHKGFALRKIQEQYNISRAETLVFGDYNNDLEMMALSDYSVAMENAHPNVLNAAKYRTLSNDAFGVERVIQKLVEIPS
jgi:Cof subfamily protein (haloacid dehalogenase superfamily)